MAHLKILMIVAHDGYQPLEYQIPKKTLHHAGYAIVTASNKPGTATAKDGSTTHVDLLIQDAIARDYAALIVVGGSGAMDNLDNPDTYQLLTEARDLDILIGAICIAPRILAHASLLTEVRATGWNEDGELESILEEHGAIYVQEPVVIDQHIVTATGPSQAQAFADEIVKELRR